MLGTFLDRLGTLFPNSFIVVFWAPAFLGLASSIAVVIIASGFEASIDWWDERGDTEKLLVAATVLVTATLLGFLLQASVVMVVRLYEGYWPEAIRPLTEWAISNQRGALASLRNKADAGDASAYSVWHFSFPQDDASVQPTRLGNVLAAAEDYPRQMYQIDAPLWWPRLFPHLPETLRGEIDSALTPVLTLLNLATVIALVSIGGGCVLWWFEPWPVFVAVFLGGISLAWLCYRAAASQAVIYGDLIRVAFDLHRFEVLKAMRIPVPGNFVDETLLWPALNTWIITPYTAPWETEWAKKLEVLSWPFEYQIDAVGGPTTYKVQANLTHSFGLLKRFRRT